MINSYKFGWLASIGAGLLLALSVPLEASTAPLGRTQTGATGLVADPNAPGGHCLAVHITEEPGSADLTMPFPALVPGYYRVSLPICIHSRPGFNPAFLKLTVNFNAGNTIWPPYSPPPYLVAGPGAYQLAHASFFSLAPCQLDGTTDAWTVLTRPVLLLSSVTPNHLTISWSFVKTPGQSSNAFDYKTNVTDSAGVETKPTVDAATTDILNEMDADTRLPLSKIDYPALLVGDPVIEPVSTTYIVEKVWPEYVHVYPGGTNPVTVTVHNFTDKPTAAKVHLEMQSGLDESASQGEQPVTIPAHGAVAVKFPWVAGTREFGYGAVATLLIDGKPVHTNAEYFSVSTPIWKTAIQGSGFLSWYGRERLFPLHVATNRREYINVEEAFSWQPSSWSDLNPTTEDWWTGQGNFHNTQQGLHEWAGLSHSNGIKLITYSWATTSGKDGFDVGRRFPFLLARYSNGAGGGVDLGALEMSDITHARKELWPYQSTTWQAGSIDLGRLLAINHHAQEVIKSSKTYGWDGIRFDYPPAWSGMGTGDVKAEFDMLGVNDLMKKLLPEYYDTTNESWSAEAITARNLRYFRYIFKKELGPNFAISYNSSIATALSGDQLAGYVEFCKGGGQIMNESIRASSDMATYLATALNHVLAVRQAGGYSCLFQAERCPASLGSTYSAIFTFATGSHPYGDYGWLKPLPGAYTQFMTRYGEYCWDLALAPVTPEKAGVTIESKQPLVWEKFIRQRETNGVLQTVVHLITPPEWDGDKFALQANVPWSHNVVVKKQCRAEPTVWLLTAEPAMSAVRLPVTRRDNSYAVTVPTLRYWSMLVWSEKL